MKTLFFFFSLLVMSNLFAQNCPDFYPFREGASWQLTQYNAKDKVESVSNVVVTEYHKSGDIFEVSCKNSQVDDKGKPIGEVEYSLKCLGGVLYYDMKTFIDAKTMSQFKDMQVNVTANDMQYPASLSVGTSLPDANIVMEINGGPMVITNKVYITERKVASTETITTPAGTFDCFLITYNVTSNFGFAKVEANVKEWIAYGAGMVRSENYAKGKLQGYQILTKLNK